MTTLRRTALGMGALTFLGGPVVLALVPHNPGAVAWYATSIVGLGALLVGVTDRVPGWVAVLGLYAGALLAIPLAYGWTSGAAVGYLLLLPVAPAVGVLVGPPAWALMLAGILAAVLIWRRLGGTTPVASQV